MNCVRRKARLGWIAGEIGQRTITELSCGGRAETPAAPARTMDGSTQEPGSHVELRRLCLAGSASALHASVIEGLVTSNARLRIGDTLYRAGQTCEAVYAIRTGFCKTTMISEAGREQVAGFHLAGDLIGLDGLDTGNHTLSASVLDDTEICVLSLWHRRPAATIRCCCTKYLWRPCP